MRQVWGGGAGEKNRLQYFEFGLQYLVQPLGVNPTYSTFNKALKPLSFSHTYSPRTKYRWFVQSSDAFNVTVILCSPHAKTPSQLHETVCLSYNVIYPCAVIVRAWNWFTRVLNLPSSSWFPVWSHFAPRTVFEEAVLHNMIKAWCADCVVLACLDLAGLH